MHAEKPDHQDHRQDKVSQKQDPSDIEELLLVETDEYQGYSDQKKRTEDTEEIRAEHRHNKMPFQHLVHLIVIHPVILHFLLT